MILTIELDSPHASNKQNTQIKIIAQALVVYETFQQVCSCGGNQEWSVTSDDILDVFTSIIFVC